MQQMQESLRFIKETPEGKVHIVYHGLGEQKMLPPKVQEMLHRVHQRGRYQRLQGEKPL